MTGLLTMFNPGVASNPFYQAFDQRRDLLTNTLLGGVGAENPLQRMRGMAQGALAGRETTRLLESERQKQAQAQQQINSSLRAMQRAGRDDLVQAVQGGFPITEAWNQFLKGNGADGGPSFSKTPVYMTDESGKTVLGTIGDDASFKRIDTGGLSVASGIDKIDAGTKWLLYDKRTGEKVGEQPKENYEEAFATARGKEEGSAAGQRVGNLPKVEQQANSMLATLDLLENHPGFEGSVGWQGNIPDWAIPGGTQMADFNSVMQQIQGQAFLQAFESIKGGGHITEIEGLKATQAITRLSRKLSEAEFKRAIGELRGVIQTGLERARKGIVVDSAATSPAANDPLGLR